MANKHEQENQDETNIVEVSKQTVDEFVEFSKKIFRDSARSFDVAWEDQMNRLYGDEELVRVTKSEAYRGVPGIREKLQAAYVKGGLPGLKMAFLHQTIEYTTVGNIGNVALEGFKKIIDYKTSPPDRSLGR